jgi:hypothetical protein
VAGEGNILRISWAAVFDSHPEDVGLLFESAMRELDVQEITRVDAAKILIKNTLEGILAGDIDAVYGVSFLYWDVHHELYEELPDKEYVGDSLHLEHLFCWLREIWDCRNGSRLLYYTDIPRDQAELRFKEHLLEESQKWLEEEHNQAISDDS